MALKRKRPDDETTPVRGTKFFRAPPSKAERRRAVAAAVGPHVGDVAKAVALVADFYSDALVWEERCGQDLFSLDALRGCTCSLAHCVSADFEMGRGIATQFKARFGHQRELRQLGTGVGGLAVLRSHGSERDVFYLVTKQHYWGKPTRETLTIAAAKLADYCRSNRTRELLIPRLGCGLDGLSWAGFVRPLLQRLFAFVDVAITVCEIRPS